MTFESDTCFYAGTELGLVRYAEPLWSTPVALQNIDSPVTGITEDNKGTIWISNYNRLISYHKNETATYEADPDLFTYVTGTDKVHAFPNGQIAIELKTAVDSGIYLFDPIEKNFTLAASIRRTVKFILNYE